MVVVVVVGEKSFSSAPGAEWQDGASQWEWELVRWQGQSRQPPQLPPLVVILWCASAWLISVGNNCFSEIETRWQHEENILVINFF